MKLETRSAKSWFKCVSCKEQIRTCESFLQVVHLGKDVKGERYCEGCEDIARENNTHLEEEHGDERDDEHGLRMRENYAAYLINGNPSDYWTDRDAGYVE